MLVDFRNPDPNGTLHADICVIGGGAAGIAIAREFANTRHSVVVLESGGMEVERDIQDLYKGVNTRGDFSLRSTRFRVLGGTTCVWGGWSAPLDDIDFGQRDWVPDSGWPIAKRDLLPFYRRAQVLCELGRYRYDVSEWPSLSSQTLRLDPQKMEHRLWQLSPPTHFGQKYAAELRGLDNVTVLLHATATELIAKDNAGAITGVQIASLEGKKAYVSARIYVLACGGIEVPRLMLASNGVAAAGLANHHDLVGRYFMEHPHPDTGGVLLAMDAEKFRPYFETQAEGERIALGFGPSSRAQERLQILNSSIAVQGELHSEPSGGWDSLIKLARGAEKKEWPDNAGSHVYNVLRDLDDVLREGYLRLQDEPVRGFRFVARTECAPERSNRVVLDNDRDALGMPRARLEWRLGNLERVTVERTMQLLAEEFGRLGVGRVRINELLMDDSSRWSENLSWFGHHMGTTRMSADPKKGVVDTDCRVHGITNLYVASSSVFPTAGFANPTLTILALALRLADHLKSRDIASLPAAS